MLTRKLTPEELEAGLRDLGARRYHNLHPFHKMLHSGKCNKEQVQAWALNRYFYQAMIPQKDATLIGRCNDQDIRREWRKRLDDQDGSVSGQGGLQRWLMLTDGLGLDRAVVVSTRLILPATRFAVEAYIHFVRERTLLEAIASALTEMFSPQIISERLEGMLANYSYVTPETMAYFQKRPPQAHRDAVFALDYVKEHAHTLEQQQAVIDALAFKCDVLWSMLDALHYAYVTPGLIPPGAFVPDGEASSSAAREAMTEPLTVAEDAKPRLAPGVRLQFDATRQTWLLLAPERIIETEGPTRAILSRCDGANTVRQIVDGLAKEFVAPREQINADVTELLAELVSKQLIIL